MVKERESEQHGKLVDEEIGFLAQQVREIELNHRTEIDKLKLELKTLELFLSRIYPEFDTQFNALAEKVRLEINPE